MSWFTLTDDERKELRESHAGRSLVEEIDAQIKMARDEVVSHMLDDNPDSERNARRLAGRVDGMEAIKNIIEKDPS